MKNTSEKKYLFLKERATLIPEKSLEINNGYISTEIHKFFVVRIVCNVSPSGLSGGKKSNCF